MKKEKIFLIECTDADVICVNAKPVAIFPVNEVKQRKDEIVATCSRLAEKKHGKMGRIRAPEDFSILRSFDSYEKLLELQTILRALNTNAEDCSLISTVLLADALLINDEFIPNTFYFGHFFQSWDLTTPVFSTSGKYGVALRVNVRDLFNGQRVDGGILIHGYMFTFMKTVKMELPA